LIREYSFVLLLSACTNQEVLMYQKKIHVVHLAFCKLYIHGMLWL